RTANSHRPCLLCSKKRAIGRGAVTFPGRIGGQPAVQGGCGGGIAVGRGRHERRRGATNVTNLCGGDKIVVPLRRNPRSSLRRRFGPGMHTHTAVRGNPIPFNNSSYRRRPTAVRRKFLSSFRTRVSAIRNLAED